MCSTVPSIAGLWATEESSLAAELLTVAPRSGTSPDAKSIPLRAFTSAKRMCCTARTTRTSSRSIRLLHSQSRVLAPTPSSVDRLSRFGKLRKSSRLSERSLRPKRFVRLVDRRNLPMQLLMDLVSRVEQLPPVSKIPANAAGSSHSAESRDLSRQKGVASRTREKSAAVSPSAPGFLRSSREGSAARTRTPTLSRLSVGHGSGLTREDFVNSVWKYQSGDCSWLSVGAR
jgi:hypothetical protein